MNIDRSIMSREEDDTRQYQCLRKYEAIVKQGCGPSVFRFDELIDMVDARTRPPKRRRVAVSSSSSRSMAASATAITTTTTMPPTQPSIDELFVQSITRFIHELNTSSTTYDQSASNAEY